jgi:hypothetical protein
MSESAHCGESGLPTNCERSHALYASSTFSGIISHPATSGLLQPILAAGGFLEEKIAGDIRRLISSGPTFTDFQGKTLKSVSRLLFFVTF